MLFVSGALSKDILNNNATISIRVRDIFNTQQRELTTRSGTFNQFTTIREKFPPLQLHLLIELDKRRFKTNLEKRELREDVGFLSTSGHNPCDQRLYYIC